MVILDAPSLDDDVKSIGAPLLVLDTPSCWEYIAVLDMRAPSLEDDDKSAGDPVLVLETP